MANTHDANEPLDAAPGSALLEHAQAAFMEWIKMVELELGTADDWYNKVEAALCGGNLAEFGTAIGKAHGHMQNALKLVRDATRRGFDVDDAKGPNVRVSHREE